MSEDFGSLDDFRFFMTLFRMQPIAPDLRRRCLLDKSREESFTRKAELENDLPKRILEVLEDLANGFHDFSVNQITKAGFSSALRQFADFSLPSSLRA